MAFSSLKFIFGFLPIFLMLYFCFKSKYKNIILLIGSIVFYIIGTWKNLEYLGLLFFSILINFIVAILMEKCKKEKKAILICGIIFNINFLLIYKYLDFFISIISEKMNWQVNALNLVLPIGISFYTFELISYIVDVYNEKISSEKSILKFAGYIFMFPQLISGPIVTYKDIKPQLENREITSSTLDLGLKYFIVGLAFKVIIANRIGTLWNDIFMIGVDSISSKLAWIGIIGYSLQIYFDFAGYSYMAIGLGKILGINLPENFNAPYLSKSMTEFFRKWHMSLGTWFKNYIYIPLGGNRKGKIRLVLNILVVWLITGLWHGASYNFLIWGIFVGIIIVLEKLFFGKFLEKSKILGHIYMFVLIPLMWSIFAIKDLNVLGMFMKKLFAFDIGLNPLDYLKYIKLYWGLIITGFICCTKLPENLFIRKKSNVIQSMILIVVFWISIYYLYMGMNNSFLYFNF